MLRLSGSSLKIGIRSTANKKNGDLVLHIGIEGEADDYVIVGERKSSDTLERKLDQCHLQSFSQALVVFVSGPSMPLRPFPSPFRVGIDLCEISRIQRLITPQHSRLRGSQHCYLHRFLSRVLTDSEEEAFWFRYPSEIENEIFQSGHRVSTHLAGR